MGLDGRFEFGEVPGVVLEIGIHGDHMGKAFLLGIPGRRQDGCALAPVNGMADEFRADRGGEVLGQVRTAVVYHQDLPMERLAVLDNSGNALSMVVQGNDHKDTGRMGHGAGYASSRKAFRAATVPMETTSWLVALQEMELTLMGAARFRFSAVVEVARYWAPMNPMSTKLSLCFAM